MNVSDTVLSSPRAAWEQNGGEAAQKEQCSLEAKRAGVTALGNEQLLLNDSRDLHEEPEQRFRSGAARAAGRPGTNEGELLEAERRAHGRAQSLRAPRRRCGDVRNLSARNAAPGRRGAAERCGWGTGSGAAALPGPAGRMGRKRGAGLGRSLQRQRGSERRGAASWVGAGVRRGVRGAGIHEVTAASVSAAARQRGGGRERPGAALGGGTESAGGVPGHGGACRHSLRGR